MLGRNIAFPVSYAADRDREALERERFQLMSCWVCRRRGRRKENGDGNGANADDYGNEEVG